MADKAPDEARYDRITVYFNRADPEHQAVYKKIISETSDHRKQRSAFIIRQLIKAELINEQKMNEQMVQTICSEIIEELKPLLAEMQVTKPVAQDEEPSTDDALADMDNMFGQTKY